jgi:carbamoyltransferase
MITWGISANSHDAALAVFSNDGVEFASHSERFSRIKNDPDLDKTMVRYCLHKFGSPDEIIWYERPFVKSLRQLRAGQGFKFGENRVRNYLAQYDIHAPIRYTDHHLAHAAGGYYTSGYAEACVVCIDSIGEFDTLTIWHATERHGLKKIYAQRYPNSVGLWYSAMTQRMGLKPQEDEYILMGAAAYGDPDRLYHDIKSDFVEVGDRTLVKFKKNLHRGCLDWRPDLTTEQDMFDIAAATQYVYEDILRWVLGKAAHMVNVDNLVLMGGCALNCSANSLAYDYFKNVWIMPNPGDAGSSIGCVLAHRKQHIEFNHAFLGYEIEGEYPVEQLVQELKTNKIVGVANGRAEFGPRAFGNRSLLADPRGKLIKDRVNDIKRRQRFRPFAPVILEEFADQYFDGPTGPYMQYTSTCRDPGLYPAIVHGDGTSRVQTVPPDQSLGIRRLLERWYSETGCPMLLNTSLNIKGEPMVNTRRDAERFQKRYQIKVLS